MSPKVSLEDFRALMLWLYGDPAPAPAHQDTRIDQRNLRGMMAGRSGHIPDALADYLVGRAMLRMKLKGWASSPPPVSPALLERIMDHG